MQNFDIIMFFLYFFFFAIFHTFCQFSVFYYNVNDCLPSLFSVTQRTCSFTHWWRCESKVWTQSQLQFDMYTQNKTWVCPVSSGSIIVRYEHLKPESDKRWYFSTSKSFCRRTTVMATPRLVRVKDQLFLTIQVGSRWPFCYHVKFLLAFAVETCDVSSCDITIFYMWAIFVAGAIRIW